MKHFFLTFFAIALLVTTPALAAGDIKMDVKGMVCDFCAQSIIKVFKDHPSVKDVNISLENETATLTLKDDAQPMDDEALNKLMRQAGYDIGAIERMPE